ncbi:MAG: hypothetical protein DRN17_07640 [Thermoplasmata archaeon]|nr:MAG: hypothetical protein DRN17_07640 [Thermoplasmata archaeon]
MSEKICPHCGKPYISYAIFGEPDHLDIMGRVIHSTKEVKDAFFGQTHTVPDEVCFLTVDEILKLPLTTEDRKRVIINSNRCPICGSELEKSPLYDTTYEEFNEIVGTEWYCPVCKKVVISGETLMPEFAGEKKIYTEGGD